VFHLHEQQARQVMTPAPAVVTVAISQDLQTAMQLCIASGHTRLVVIEDDNRNRVRGLVHANSLRPSVDARGSACRDRAGRAPRAHRAGDQATRRPRCRSSAPEERVEAVRENRIEWVRIRERGPAPSGEAERPEDSGA